MVGYTYTCIRKATIAFLICHYGQQAQTINKGYSHIRFESSNRRREEPTEHASRCTVSVVSADFRKFSLLLPWLVCPSAHRLYVRVLSTTRACFS